MASVIPRSPRDMVTGLNKMADGINKNTAEWPATAPTEAQVRAVADALKALMDALDEILENEATLRDQIGESMENDAESIYIMVRNVVRALFQGKEEQFGVKPRKTPQRRPVPDRPTNLRATEVGDEEVELTWDAVEGKDLYKVYSSEDPVIDDSDFVNSTTKCSIRVPVKKGVQTWFGVKANNPAGDSELSPIVSRTTY